MVVYSEEIFGAVLLVIPFDTEDEAVEIANDTTMGLAGGVFTKDLGRAYRVIDRLHAGSCFVNTFNDDTIPCCSLVISGKKETSGFNNLVKNFTHTAVSAPFVPFGGYGDSGFGRENGTAAIDHYTQIKSVIVSTAKTLPNPF
ncbi:unnamed protein product [Cylicostephanus goldi]|uniref:Aldehyde dehydrogenase domain-containing protein n=1 Tax=Cylicostephanus goldi TaxID=71465 RepID=A0A3P6RRM8_CYLGO|nr:unnamed protein product [Cylicostephanus goldi]